MSAHTYQIASPVVPMLPDRFVGVVSADGQEARVAAIVCQREGGVALLNLAGAETTAMAVAMNLVRMESNEQKAAKQKVVFTPAPDFDWAGPTTLLRITAVNYNILKAPIVNTKERNLLLLPQTGNIGAGVRDPIPIPPDPTAKPDGRPMSGPAAQAPVEPPPRFIFANHDQAHPDHLAFLGHLRALRIPTPLHWGPLLWEDGLGAGLVAPLLALGVRSWQIVAHHHRWAELVAHAIRARRLVR
jgi:hypothetical protein